VQLDKVAPDPTSRDHVFPDQVPEHVTSMIEGGSLNLSQPLPHANFISFVVRTSSVSGSFDAPDYQASHDFFRMNRRLPQQTP
jgi:hypothetical protein